MQRLGKSDAADWTVRWSSRMSALAVRAAALRCEIGSRGRLETVLLPLTIAAVALFITVFDNSPLWSATLRATVLDEHQDAILVSLFVAVLTTLIIPLTLAAGVRGMKAVAIVLLLIAAAASFSMSGYGAMIDASMIRSLAQADVTPLLTSGFLVHLGIFGVVPALAVALVPIARAGWRRELVVRTVVLIISVVTAAGTMYVNYGPLSLFARENRQLHLLVNPAYPVYSAIRYLSDADAEHAKESAPPPRLSDATRPARGFASVPADAATLRLQ
jgi:glucan phosphoethanolaminetransferase (alkaline phosphatase superfamily)